MVEVLVLRKLDVLAFAVEAPGAIFFSVPVRRGQRSMNDAGGAGVAIVVGRIPGAVEELP